jgi:hypothetical protein
VPHMRRGSSCEERRSDQAMKEQAQARIGFGIYDTSGDCWIGDSKGPKLFDDFELARVAAQVCEMQVCGTDLRGAYRARPYPMGAPVRLKDKIKLRHMALKVLQRIEGVEE